MQKGIQPHQLLLPLFALILCASLLAGIYPASPPGAPAAPSFSAQPDLVGTALATALLDSSKAFGSQGKLEQGLALANRATFHFAQALGPLDSMTLYSVLVRGDFLWRLRRFDEADRAMDSCITGSYASIDSIHTLASGAYGTMGITHLFRGQFDQAEQYLLKSIAMDSTIFGAESEDVAKLFNNLGATYFYAGQFERAIAPYTRSLNIRAKAEQPDTGLIGGSYSNIGGCWQRLSNYQKALENYEKAAAILRAQHPLQDQLSLSNALSNMGTMYTELGQQERAIPLFREALAYRFQTLPPGHPNIAMLRLNMGQAYGEMGEVGKAVLLYEKGISEMLAAGEREDRILADLYNNSGQQWRKAGETEIAFHHTQEAIRIHQKKSGPGHRSTLKSKSNLAILHHELGQSDTALAILDENLAMLYASFDSVHAEIGTHQNYKGSILLEQGRLNEAKACFQEALRVRLALFGTKHLQVHISLNNLGTAAVQQGDLELAFQYYHAALNSLDWAKPVAAVSAFDAMCNLGEAHFKNGAPDSAVYWLSRACSGLNYDLLALPRAFKQVRLPVSLLQPLNIYANFLGRYPGHTDTIGAQLEVYETLAALDKYLQGSRINPGRQIEFTRLSKPIFEKGIRLLLSRAAPGDLEKAFLWAGQSRARQISAQLALSSSNQQNLNAADQQKLDTLQQRIAMTEQALLQQQLRNVPAPLADSLTSVLFGLRQEQLSYDKYLHDTYPGYTKARAASPLLGLSEVRQLLRDSPHDLLLDYFLGDSSLFIFAVTKDTALAVAVGGAGKVPALAASFLQAVSMPPGQDTSHLPRFVQSAARLYELLIEPVGRAFKPRQRLLIVPDDILWQLPFEALAPGPPERYKNWRAIPYLIQQHPISYAFSPSAYQDMLLRQERPGLKWGVLAFAPDFTPGDTTANGLTQARMAPGPLAQLPFAVEEARLAVEVLGGEAITGHAASASAFHSMSSKWQALHLATHSKGNPQAGHLGFAALAPEPNDTSRQSWLYTNDLYNADIPAELVVLSGCETGSGELKPGEGMISLARGFAYAGAGSVVSSLWAIPDQSTSRFMRTFYTLLSEGKPKHLALQQAKKDLINSPYQEPCFWAAFTLTGNPEPLSQPPLWPWGLIFLMVSMLALLRRSGSK